MTQDKQWVAGGLVFLGTRQIDITETVQRVADALEAFGNRVLGMRIGSAKTGFLQTTYHDVQLALHHDDSAALPRGAAGVFMNVEVTNRPEAQSAEAMAADLLLIQLRRMLHQSYVAKCDERSAGHPGRPIEAVPHTDDPCAAGGAQCGQVEPRLPDLRRGLLRRRCPRSTSQVEYERQRSHILARISHEQKWDQAPEDQFHLRTAMRDPDLVEQSDPSEMDRIRLSAWLLSIAVALLCLPVGVALAVINLFRGENLRLASQTAALTGTFVTLQATGAVAQATQVIQTVLS